MLATGAGRDAPDPGLTSFEINLMSNG